MKIGINSREIEKDTRKTFHKIHTLQAQDKRIFQRLHALLGTEYLEVEKDFFRGKICLDAGCGLNANAVSALLGLGAQKVYGLDINPAVLKYAPAHLRPFKSKYELKVGSVTNMEFPDNFFDFVHCSGTLHHLADPLQGIKELGRVTKTGGMLYINIDGPGGIIREVIHSLRGIYRKDNNLKVFIDNLDEQQILEIWQWMAETMRSQGDVFVQKLPIVFFKSLFNHDLVLTIKDRIMPYYYHEMSEEELRNCLSENGFIKMKRLTRYPKINNIRRFLCPFYYRYDHKFSRLLYGEGMIQLKAVKAG
jgi:ubiquinone/menaquinone biosynthesis C-methylase UbiE